MKASTTTNIHFRDEKAEVTSIRKSDTEGKVKSNEAMLMFSA